MLNSACGKMGKASANIKVPQHSPTKQKPEKIRDEDSFASSEAVNEQNTCSVWMVAVAAG